MASPPPAKPKSPSTSALKAQLQRAELELTLAETTYTTSLLSQLTQQESALNLRDMSDPGWIPMSGTGMGTDEKDIPALTGDAAQARKQSYWFWRTNPHARGIIRNFERFIMGHPFSIDFEDTQRGKWNDDHTQVTVTDDEEDGLVVAHVWKDFKEVNDFDNRMKETVRRTMRDGGAFIRRFNRAGFITIRFVEPAHVQGTGDTAVVASGIGKGTVKEGDVDAAVLRVHPKIVGQATEIVDGIEYLAEDSETVVAYHIGKTPASTTRVPAADIIQTKPLADSNDLRGLLLLEVVMRHLAEYAQWEQYRIILNKVRTAVALVRKVDGTSLQANAIIAGRASTRPGTPGTEPQTLSGRREAMPKAGTIITAGPGVDWDFKRPNLDAADAEHDGRRILLSVAAGVGLPEMMVTSDYSNSNYSSSVEARTPAVREWEDWQKFFEPVVRRIMRWVVDAAKDKLGLPKEITGNIAIQWPPLINTDSDKATLRNATLNANDIMSKKTWASREDLNFDEEVQNFRDEAEFAADLPHYVDPALMVPSVPRIPHPDSSRTEPGMPRTPRSDGTEARAQLVSAFADISSLLEATDVPVPLREALTRYTEAAQQIVGAFPRAEP